MNFDNFFKTMDTIEKGFGFNHFDGYHLSWIIFTFLVCSITIYFFRKSDSTKRKSFFKTISILLIIDELIKYLGTSLTGQFVWEYLPLHLCSINIFIILSDVIKPSNFKRNLLYFLCLPGALAALLMPSWTDLPFLNFMSLHSFTVHILLTLYPLLLLFDGFKPEFKLMFKSLLWIISICPFIYGINILLGTNFMFLMEAPIGTPLVLFEKFLGNPGFLIGYPILLLFVWSIMYLSFKSNNRQQLLDANF